MNDILTKILLGAAGGLAYSFTGYLKNAKDVDFNWLRLIPTLLIGAVSGGVAGYMNLEMGAFETTATGMAIAAGLQNLWKGFLKLIVKE